MKKSQVTIFFIIGFVILIISAFIYIKLNNDKIDNIKNQLNPDEKKIEPFQKYVESCLDRTGAETLKKLGEQGLLYPEAYINTKDARIAYIYFKGKGYYPEDIALIEDQVSKNIDENIANCTTNFKKQGFVVIFPETNISVGSVFSSKDINITLEYPAKVFVDGEEFTLSKVSRKIKIDFLKIYSITGEIYKKTKDSPEWISLEYAKEYNFDIRLIKVDKATLIYEITDSKYGLDSKPYVYRFAVKYNL